MEKPDLYSVAIEAVVEDLDIKSKVLENVIPALRDDCIIATNTSSLSITKIGQAIGQPHRTVGMHFFNPAPIMKLVEVIKGENTCTAVVDRVAEIAVSWGKMVARAADVPGFIVNHVARPYYLEAFRILEDATPMKPSASPMGSATTAGAAPSFSSIWLTTRQNSEPTRSILFTNAILGTPYLLA